MKVRITLDLELANSILAAAVTHAVDIAKHAKQHPGSPFEWGRYLRELNETNDAFRKALGNAELVTLD